MLVRETFKYVGREEIHSGFLANSWELPSSLLNSEMIGGCFSEIFETFSMFLRTTCLMLKLRSLTWVPLIFGDGSHDLCSFSSSNSHENSQFCIKFVIYRIHKMTFFFLTVPWLIQDSNIFQREKTRLHTKNKKSVWHWTFQQQRCKLEENGTKPS